MGFKTFQLEWMISKKCYGWANPNSSDLDKGHEFFCVVQRLKTGYPIVVFQLLYKERQQQICGMSARTMDE